MEQRLTLLPTRNSIAVTDSDQGFNPASIVGLQVNTAIKGMPYAIACAGHVEFFYW